MAHENTHGHNPGEGSQEQSGTHPHPKPDAPKSPPFDPEQSGKVKPPLPVPRPDSRNPAAKAADPRTELMNTMNQAAQINNKLMHIIKAAGDMGEELKKSLYTRETQEELKKVLGSINTSLVNLEDRVKKLEESPASHTATAPGEEGKKDSSAHHASPPVSIPMKSELNADLDDILLLLVEHKASDLHLKVGSPPMVRIEGELIQVGDQSLTPRDTQRLILNMMSPEMIQNLYRRNELDFSYQSPSGRFRVNAFLQKSTVSASMRLVRMDIPSFEKLYLPSSLEKAAEYHNGLFLVTGPAGSGKSTTLASLLDYINTNKKLHVVTIEDPIEYIFEDRNCIITQREVGIDTESFEQAVRMSLRQDPNVIMIGELRDAETVMQAVMAAETGHLVFSTLHTPNTIQALRRLMDFFPPALQDTFRTSLASTLRGIISQRLIRRKDQEGRIPAVELFFTTPTIGSLIREGNVEEIYGYMKEGLSEGMLTFTESLSRLHKAGLISKEDAMYHAEQYTELRLAITASEEGREPPKEGTKKWWYDQM